MKAFAPDLWLIDGPVVTAALGFHDPTRMAVVRLADGTLWLWSPVALTPVLRAQVDALGPVAVLVAPNTLHHLALGDWQVAYPQARVWAVPRLENKRPDLRIDHTFGRDPAPWADQIEPLVFDTNRITTEAVFLHRASGTVLVTDLLQQMPRGWYRGWRALVAQWDGMTGPEPAVPLKFRMTFKDKPRVLAQIRHLLSWPAQRVVMAHGDPVTQDAHGVLARAFAWSKA